MIRRNPLDISIPCTGQQCQFQHHPGLEWLSTTCNFTQHSTHASNIYILIRLLLCWATVGFIEVNYYYLNWVNGRKELLILLLVSAGIIQWQKSVFGECPIKSICIFSSPLSLHLKEMLCLFLVVRAGFWLGYRTALSTPSPSPPEPPDLTGPMQRPR